MLFTYKTHNIKFKIMKKLIFIIAIILTANAVSAQLSGLLGYIKERPAYEFSHVPFAVKQGADGRFVYDLTPQKFQQIQYSTPAVYLYGYFVFDLIAHLFHFPRDQFFLY